MNPLPEASIAGNIQVCNNSTAPLVTFTGDNGTANYIFTYEVNGGTNQTVTSSGPTATVTQLTGTGGTFVYTLISVEDANGCSQLLGGTATVIVNVPLVAPIVSASQSICYSSGTAALNATPATGGTGPFSYQWQRSPNGLAPWTNVKTNSTSFAPGILTRTYYYQVIATDAGSPACGNVTSNIVKITVAQPFTQPEIGSNQTICYNTVPSALSVTTLATGSTSGFSYIWEQSIDGLNWDETGFTGISYTPAALTATTWYRVIGSDLSVPSCGYVFSSNTVKITVQDEVIPGVIASAQSVCWGTAPTLLTGPVATGSGTISYQWQISTDGTTFNNIDLATGIDYQSGNLTEDTWYRRVASSTLNGNVCTAYSDVKVTVIPLPLTDAPEAVEACDSYTLPPLIVGNYYTVSGKTGNKLLVGESITSTATLYVYAETGTTPNCWVENSFTVTINTPPVATITVIGSTTVCYGGSVTLTASEGTAYLWSPCGGTTQSIVVTQSGDYSVTVYNGICFATSAPITITINTEVSGTVVSQTDIDCNISAGGLVIQGTGGTSNEPGTNYDYRIDGGHFTGNGFFNDVSAGAHTIEIRDAIGCTGTIQVFIESNTTAPEAPLASVTAQPTCTVQTGTITVSSALAGLTFSIDGNNYTNTNGIFTGVTAGTYYVTAKNSYGCISAPSSAVIINTQPTAPEAPIITVVNNCNGTSTLSTTAAGTLLWSTNESSASITVNAAGTYTVTTTVNGCTSAAGSGVAAPKTAPATPVVTVANNCGGSVLSIPAGGTIAWSNGASTASITVTTGGTYTVTRTVDGCTSLAGLGTAAPKIIPATPVVTVANNCGSSVLSIPAGGTIAWSNGASTASITVTTAGTYTVTRTVDGCTSLAGSGTAAPKTPPFATIAYIGSPFNRSVSGTVNVTRTGTTGGIYTASPAGLAINSLTGAITPSTSGIATYTVTYTVANPGCPTFTTTTSVAIVQPSGTNTTVLTYIGHLSVVVNNQATLTAILTNSSGRGISGKTITFTIGSQSITATTNGSGRASVKMLVTQLPGVYTVNAGFNGDNTYKNSNDNEVFTINPGLYASSSNVNKNTVASDNSEEITTAIAPEVGYADLKVYPNPFSEKLRFEFVSPEAVNARIELYDMTGRMVKTIFEQPINGGISYEAEFRPETIISGMYIYRVILGEAIYNGKVVFKK